MTVYVDDMEAKYRPKHRPGVVYVMSHMIADTEAELHDLAAKIGVARKWYQGDHYDITQAAKARALKLGAVQITWRQASCMMALKRFGMPMGKPETAKQRLQDWYSSRRR